MKTKEYWDSSMLLDVLLFIRPCFVQESYRISPNRIKYPTNHRKDQNNYHDFVYVSTSSKFNSRRTEHLPCELLKNRKDSSLSVLYHIKRVKKKSISSFTLPIRLYTFYMTLFLLLTPMNYTSACSRRFPVKMRPPIASHLIGDIETNFSFTSISSLLYSYISTPPWGTFLLSNHSVWSNSSNPSNSITKNTSDHFSTGVYRISFNYSSEISLNETLTTKHKDCNQSTSHNQMPCGPKGYCQEGRCYCKPPFFGTDCHYYIEKNTNTIMKASITSGLIAALLFAATLIFGLYLILQRKKRSSHLKLTISSSPSSNIRHKSAPLLLLDTFSHTNTYHDLNLVNNVYSHDPLLFSYQSQSPSKGKTKNALNLSQNTALDDLYGRFMPNSLDGTTVSADTTNIDLDSDNRGREGFFRPFGASLKEILRCISLIDYNVDQYSIPETINTSPIPPNRISKNEDNENSER
ncbi:unnamed protein product [Gordionus sp. m RMFG-2023]